MSNINLNLYKIFCKVAQSKSYSEAAEKLDLSVANVSTQIANLEEQLDLESITVMVQKEVGDRLIAIPGDKETGAITYTVYYYAGSQKILEVPNNSFIPEPEVTSEVIKLNIRKKEPIEVSDKKLMFKIIKNAFMHFLLMFMQRRKTLVNALTNSKIFLNKEEGIKILKEIGLNENIRAEKLTLQNFADITNMICSKTI